MNSPRVNAQACISGNTRQDSRTILKRILMLFIAQTMTKIEEIW